MSLRKYKQKRHFDRTSEPLGTPHRHEEGPLRFVVQKHHARRLHYDFRLEIGGTLKSWAVPKGPSLDPNDKRLAMMVEDHPIEYGSFEGTIPKGEYGGGTVMIWDEGTVTAPGCSTRADCEKALAEGLRTGNLKFILEGKKLRGEFVLVKMSGREPNAWLLIKKRDDGANGSTDSLDDRSAKTGKTMDEIALSDSVWHSNRPASKGAKRFPGPGVTITRTPEPVDLSDIPKGKFPTEVKPMLATLVDEPFDRPGWVFEVKWDGYRAIAEVQGDKVRLYSRKQLTFTQYPLVNESLKKLGHVAVLDGEVVVLDAQGVSRFQLLQQYQKTRTGRLAYYVFDLIHLDGHDLHNVPLVRRKEILAKIICGIPNVYLSEHIEEHGLAFFKAVSKNDLEGMIAKNGTSPYREGVRGKNWLKIKTHLRQEAVIAGYTEGEGARKDFGAVVLGVYEGDELVYIGRAGSGFTAKSIADVKARLEPLIQKQCPFKVKPKLEDPVHWVKPVLVCEISFREWTEDGHARFPIFEGLREDKDPRSVHRETPKTLAEEGLDGRKSATTTTTSAPRPNPKATTLSVGGHNLQLTNLKKVFWPDEGYTKGDLIDYYRAVAPFILPHLRDRPLSLNRFPDGINGKNFFQKHAGPYIADWIEKISLYSDSSARDIHYILCQNEATLVYLANLGCIELHPWFSRVGSLDQPDFLMIDLDPEEVPFDKVVAVCQTVRKVLADCGIEGVCKTSGKRGLHVAVPLGAKYDYDIAKQFAELLANLVHAQMPEWTSLIRSPAQRRGRIYLDYIQNRRGQTVASAYSVRPRPGATVSTPLRWTEVKRGLDPTKFTIRTVPKRLDKVGDLWQPVLGKGVDLHRCMKELMDKSGASR